MPEVPGCPTSSWILQYAGQHAFLAILTHNPQRSGKYVTYVTVPQRERQHLTADLTE